MATWLLDLLGMLVVAPVAGRIPWLAWEVCGLGHPYAAGLASVAAAAAAVAAASLGTRSLARISGQRGDAATDARRAVSFLLLTSVGAIAFTALAILIAGLVVGFASSRAA